jgi:hypothetical protein
MPSFSPLESYDDGMVIRCPRWDFTDMEVMKLTCSHAEDSSKHK